MLVSLLGLLGSAVALNAAVKPPDVTITLNPSVPSPEMLGTSIKWTATVSGGQQGHTYDYQFSVALGSQNQIVRDFGVNNAFTWVPYQVEGTYTVTVIVRDTTQQPYTIYPPVSGQYTLTPWVTQSGGSAVNPTAHPLVALFSAGPCTAGHSIRVRFTESGTQNSGTTNSVACSNNSANFLVGGMKATTLYKMHWEEYGPGFGGTSGPDQNFTTGPLPHGFPPLLKFQVNVPATQHDAAFPIIYWQFIPTPGRPFTFWPVASDLTGNVVWYYPGQLGLVRSEVGGNFFAMGNFVLSEYDVAGNEVLETNPYILNEQLTAKGYPVMTSFNAHEARRLPNGNILIIGARDETSTMYQGGTKDKPVDILGDMILILDHNMQLLWAWDAFAHQDLSRGATMGEICVQNTGAGCPAFNKQFQQANDWLHSNSVQLTNDGNLLLSERNQDWVLKINYANGQGDGSIIWKMGPFGDFTITNPPQHPCGDPAVFPWFTHQHDVAFQVQTSALKLMTVFDDGNLRRAQCNNTGNSRGMVMSVNEAAHSITYLTVADLGQYSFALGSAQLLISPPNNFYASFGNGFLNIPSDAAQATETDLAGNIVYQLQADQWSYRSYRMQDLYTPTLP